LADKQIATWSECFDGDYSITLMVYRGGRN